MKLDLRKGDLFLSRNPMMLGRIINANQKFWSTDNKSKYSHAGIIIDRYGTTLEALWTFKYQNLYEGYKDTEILIARHKEMTSNVFNKGYDAIKHHIGQWYPFYRIILMIIPPIGKYIHWNRIVCSEANYKFINKCGLSNDEWFGKTPDNLHDLVINSKDYDIIFEGKI